MDTCKDCGESAVETEDHNGEVQRVCTSCGALQEQSVSFSTEQQELTYFPNNGRDLFANQSAPLHIQRESKSKNVEGRRQGYQKLAVLVSHFHLSQGMKEAVYQMFNRAMLDKTILMWRQKKKTVLAGCCVYAIMRQHDWPINVSQMCSALGCSKVDFSKSYFKFVKLLGVAVVTTPIEDLVDRFIQECKDLEKTEKKLLTSRVRGILQMAKDCWLTEGRSSRPLLLAAIYVAWQSFDLKRGRVTLKEFCNRMGLAFQMNLYKGKNELFELLCGLVHKIPWLETEEISSINLYKYLEELLKYSEAVVHESSEQTGTSRQTKPTETREEPSTISLEITDKEIDSYIRSEKEVSFILKMNEAFDSDNDSK